jgi:hypothetical protein
MNLEYLAEFKKRCEEYLNRQKLSNLLLQHLSITNVNPLGSTTSIKFGCANEKRESDVACTSKRSKASSIKNGTLAWCRIVISILKEVLNQHFTEEYRFSLPDLKKYKNLSDYILENTGDNTEIQALQQSGLGRLCLMYIHLQRIGRKQEIQKQPKLKIKSLLIKSVSDDDSFPHLTLDQSNEFRIQFYNYIVQMIKTGKFDEKFCDMSLYAKSTKDGKTGLVVNCQTGYTDDKVKKTLELYKEEILDPTTFRGLHLSNEYHPDVEWCDAMGALNKGRKRKRSSHSIPDSAKQEMIKQEMVKEEMELPTEAHKKVKQDVKIALRCH